jgi:hypothetical protein
MSYKACIRELESLLEEHHQHFGPRLLKSSFSQKPDRERVASYQKTVDLLLEIMQK